MNYFETEIAKYKKRLEKIYSSPKSNMLASNRLLYEALLDHNEKQLAWWKAGKPFLTFAGGHGSAIMGRCFGEFRPMGLVQMADRLGSNDAEVAFDKARAMGLPDYACDRTILLMPVAAEGVGLPRPKMVVTRNGSCNVGSNCHRTLAHMMGVPVFTVDVPFEDPHQQHLGYVTKQIGELIQFVEASLPGAKFDEKRLMELQRFDRRWLVALHDIYRLRLQVPCPDHPRDVFREPLHPAYYVEPLKIVEYYEAYRDELQERVRNGFSSVGAEKLRIVWAITGPYGSGVWDYLVSRGVSVPYWHYGGGEKNFIAPMLGDETEFGRKLTPLEEVARTLLYNSWGGSGERWINDTLAECKKAQADGLVMFEQTGCSPVLGLGKIIMDRLETERGIPALCVEGRMLLGHTERSQAEFMSALVPFIDLCLDRKKERATARV